MNTLIGFGIIFCFTFLGIIPEISNLLGYMVGIVCSYLLNRVFTFKNNKKGDFFRFVVAMGASYVLNLLTLVLCFRWFEINVYVAQVLAGLVYTVSGFLMSRYFVWR